MNLTKSILLTVCIGAALGAQTLFAKPRPERPAATSKFYEIRVYHAAPGKFDAIVDRFRQYTTKIFEKHGMENIGYWLPTDTSRHEIIYILAYPSREARDASWKAFGADPEWKAVVAKTEANGRLVSKVDQVFMTEWEHSPKLKLKEKTPNRTFELRTYTASPGKLPDLLSRFENHTMKLFKKHGMENIAYWITTDPTKPDDSGQARLVYLLAHPGPGDAAGKKAFEAFRADPDWVKAKGESEKNGSLTVKVESTYMIPTDYSKLK